ncbi:DUF1624 domain-containing protein [Acinetobacter sp. MD2(2019)]|uniref:DUF1624 domain-containing protein n=1 Tax=Acinetobacter sp. MD2(2019) TaxID=2605273 RepID=UPI002D1E75CD|nr:heparan-alpha-glucosaminide N-acetyltransferase domain-containing protein [Acinetobacter sp. MD2(2019)]MEB3754139.1 DUF1624 domain-containing protein [Acinetobacter sp. MD2(2019)]
MSAPNQRLQAIDALRGLVMLIMLLDHVRETFYLHHQVSDPMQIDQLEPDLFISRSLAHLCAPVFVLLTGLSAFLYQQKYGLNMTRDFLLKRGLFLIGLELTVINFAWTAKFPPDALYLQVIWAIGISMLALSLLIGLSKKLLWILALGIIFLHNTLDHIHFQSETLQAFWNVLHHRGWIEISDSLRLRTTYPVLPWIGVITLGYCLGHACFKDGISCLERNQKLLKFALSGLGIFFVMRGLNIYGDQPWQHLGNISQSMMSFFNLTKYPPSLFFILWNGSLGILCLLGLNKFEHKTWLRPLIVLGSVPMFFYVLHLYVLKALYLMAFQIWGANQGQYFGVSEVYQLWMISVILMVLLYPAVVRFSKFKHQNKHIAILKYF